ncbi:uncharacterized protein IUM83_15800 [Phytophthora cinnamomi]|uniref:uncharacterized protein n=1 Tax=Phytophthora cinnamomi TaxID=4785 RepID=UPI00355953B3|nr:hypothetical protein IUM83_15800 [Phytophthora cinnamomi]
MPRKPSAARLAKEKEKEERRAVAEQHCDTSAEAEKRGAAALEEVRKRLEATAAAKTKKRKTSVVTKKTKKSSPINLQFYVRALLRTSTAVLAPPPTPTLENDPTERDRSTSDSLNVDECASPIVADAMASPPAAFAAVPSADGYEKPCGDVNQIDGGAERSWGILEPAEMADFAGSEENMADMCESGWTFDADHFPPDQRYPGLYVGEYGPTDEVLALADSPLKIFFFFMPKILWRNVAKETKPYFVQNLESGVERTFNNHKVP